MKESKDQWKIKAKIDLFKFPISSTNFFSTEKWKLKCRRRQRRENFFEWSKMTFCFEYIIQITRRWKWLAQTENDIQRRARRKKLFSFNAPIIESWKRSYPHFKTMVLWFSTWYWILVYVERQKKPRKHCDDIQFFIKLLELLTWLDERYNLSNQRLVFGNAI